MNDIAKRFPQNPLLRPSDLKPSSKELDIICLLNPGVFSYENKTWILVRVAECAAKKVGFVFYPFLNDYGEIEIVEIPLSHPELIVTDARILNYKGFDYLTTLSHLRVLCSDDGINFYEPKGYELIRGIGELENFGIEDCRVSKIADTYFLTYTAVSENGVGVGLRTTKNWKEFQNFGMIFPPHNKDCAIFEELINGKYYALHRPSSPLLGGNFIWIAESPDGIHWGNYKCILKTRSGMWDSERIGAGAAPIKTEKGLLAIYHGANAENFYCLGAFLMDSNDPSKIIARSINPIMSPKESYELSGFFAGVVFTNGHLVNGDNLTIYYGASDEYICAAQFSIAEILSTLE